MQRGMTGVYQVSRSEHEVVRSFVPCALPPEPPLELTAERRRQLELATLALGRLDSVSLLLPDPDLFLYSYIRREAVLSSQIEGSQSSLSDLLLFESESATGVPVADDVVEVSNYVAALQLGMRRLQEGLPLSNRLLREVHGRLLASGRGSSKQPGEFRRSQVWLGGTRPGNALFVPPPAHEVGRCMAALEKFIHAEPPDPVLIAAALAHVQFETIHPFLDGNGRVGRLLIALMLHDAGALAQPLLYLSLFFKQHRAEYYRLLDRVRTEGDWEAWLDYFLEGVQDTADGAVKTARRLVEQFEHDRRRVTALGRVAGTGLQVLAAFRDRPVQNLAALCERTHLTFPTVNARIADLQKLGLARELTGKLRDRVFAYQPYVEILSEGAEPL